MRRGVTIVELLVVISIIAVLTTLAIPLVRNSIRTANDAQNLSNLRQTMIDAQGFANDNKDRILNPGLPSDPQSWWWSLSNTEEAARDLGAPTRVREKSRGAVQVVDPDLANLVDILRARVQTQVRLRGNASRGRIEIDYVGADELTRLVDLILGEP